MRALNTSSSQIKEIALESIIDHKYTLTITILIISFQFFRIASSYLCYASIYFRFIGFAMCTTEVNA